MKSQAAKKLLNSPEVKDPLAFVNDQLPASLKYKLYTDAVQSPAETVKTLSDIYQDIFKQSPKTLREDFCGTFLVGCEWVNSAPDRHALGLDLDPEALTHAKRNITLKLKAGDRKRAIVCMQDVRVPAIPRVDLIAAENFSFYIFKKRQDLVSYFRAAYASLNNNGVLSLDMIGGEGFTNSPHNSQKTMKETQTGLPCPVIYRWRQRQYNAVTNEAKYYIDFKIREHWYNDIFSYDWRIWSIPEVKDALNEAGFGTVKIYVHDEKSKGPCVKTITEIGSKWETWGCVLAAIKSS